MPNSPPAFLRFQLLRSIEQADQGAPHGMAATRTEERLAASVGLLEQAPPQFHKVVDVPSGGVLLALPALLLPYVLRAVGE